MYGTAIETGGPGYRSLTLRIAERDPGHMLDIDGEIERLTREMIAQHGAQAARIAAERLNDMIDRQNGRGRDVWACVVHAIHERLGSGPIWADWMPAIHGSRDLSAAARHPR